jgi:hypothetical protein
MREGGLGRLQKRMRRFGDTLNPDDAYLSCEFGCSSLESQLFSVMGSV